MNLNVTRLGPGGGAVNHTLAQGLVQLPCRALSVSPDGKILAVGSGTSGYARLLVETNRLEHIGVEARGKQ
jgi:hypothetical protein